MFLVVNYQHLLYFQSKQSDCHRMQPLLEDIERGVESMTKECPKHDVTVIKGRKEELDQQVERVTETLSARQDLCHKWLDYESLATATQDKVRSLQGQLESADFQEEDAGKVKTELDAAVTQLSKWEQEAGDLDDLSAKAEMTIKDRSSQRSLHFSVETKSVLRSCEQMCLAVEQKEGALHEIAEQWGTFCEDTDGLLLWLKDEQMKLDTARMTEASPEGLQVLITQTKVSQKSFLKNLFHNFPFKRVKTFALAHPVKCISDSPSSLTWKALLTTLFFGPLSH